MNAKLLIVDDDPDTIRVLSGILRGMGDLYFSTSGLDAIRTVREKMPDIVLLDAEMPGMNGFEVCAALKAEPVTAAASIIFVTAHSDVENETRALELGAIDFIHKPVSPPIVRARVRNHITMKAQADELNRLASTDPLTGLANRRAFTAALELEWRRAHRSGHSLALLMLDLDYFKQFNDCYGHPAGDACLQATARILALSARRPGEMAARYGGEEFVILLPDVDGRGGEAVAEGVRLALWALEMPHEMSPLGGIVTGSIGVASVVPKDGAVAASLIAAADAALYQAKQSGRNRVFNGCSSPVKTE